MKKVWIILGILVVVGLVIFGGYWLRTKSSPAAPVTGELPNPAPTVPVPTATTSAVAQPTTPVGLSKEIVSLSLLGSEKAVAFAVASDTSVYALGLTGKVFQVSPDGITTFINETEQEGFFKASFSADASRIIASFGSQGSLRFNVYDLQKNTWTSLPSTVIGADWQPGTSTLAYVTDSKGLKTVYSLDMKNDKAKPKQLFTVHLEDINLSWPSVGQIVISERPSAFVKTSVYVFDVSKKILSAPLFENYGLSINWDKTFSRGLVLSSSQNGKGANLKVVSSSGSTINGVGFITLPEKCLFSYPSVTPIITTSTKPVAPVAPQPPQDLFCAIPRSQNVLGIRDLPDSYLEHRLFTADSVYKIGIEDGMATTVFDDTDKNMDITNPTISGNRYIFINRYDDGLYVLPLANQ